MTCKDCIFNKNKACQLESYPKTVLNEGFPDWCKYGEAVKCYEIPASAIKKGMMVYYNNKWHEATEDSRESNQSGVTNYRFWADAPGETLVIFSKHQKAIIK